jgi:hypothetical protein
MLQRNAREVSKTLLAGSAGGYIGTTTMENKSLIYSFTFPFFVYVVVLVGFLFLERIHGPRLRICQ